jgi:hypothetical protein
VRPQWRGAKPDDDEGNLPPVNGDPPTDEHTQSAAQGERHPRLCPVLNKSLQRSLWADETADTACPRPSRRMRTCCSQRH